MVTVQSPSGNSIDMLWNRALLSTALMHDTIALSKPLDTCAAGFALLNLPKGKSLGRSKPETNSYAQALATHCVGFLLYPSSAELPYAK